MGHVNAAPINLNRWIEEHRHLLKPPVGNQYLYRGTDFLVMIVGGPNARNDFHITDSEEWFYQVKGDIVVQTRENGRIISHKLREGDTFFIPPNVPHSPQRPPDTIGIVVERVRPPNEMGSTTSIPIAANTNLTLSGSSPSVTLMAHDISQGQVVETISASVIAPGGLSVLANRTTRNSFVRFANITNNIVGSLVIGTPGNGSYGGTTALYCDFNTPTPTDLYASLLNNTTNVTVHSNASFRISNHNSGSIGTVQWPKRLTLSGYGRNGLNGAWVITGNFGDNFVTDLVLAGDSLIDINAAATQTL